VIEAIESVRANNYRNIQHIIIDDCSSDPVPKQTVKKWIEDNNYPCEFHEHNINYGICKTLNHVLELAKGEYILGCSDDLLTHDRIVNDIELFKKLPEDYAIVFGMSQHIDENSELLPSVIPNLSIPENDNFWKLLIHYNCLSASSTTYRIEILKKSGGFNEDIKFEDYEINLRLANLGYKFKCNPNINSFYRIHGESISNSLNFELENIKILSLFSNREDIEKIIRKKLWDMVHNKRVGYLEALKIYEDSFQNNKLLRIMSKTKNRKILMLFNFFFNKNYR
jgi:GT2 family glycosyltransferase